MPYSVSLFSKRNLKALIDKKIRVSLSARLRKRIILLMRQYDSEINDNKLSETNEELQRQYGVDELTIDVDGKKKRVGLEDFVLEGYPDKVLDVVEVFWKQFYSKDDRRDSFQRDLSQAMMEENSPWILNNGYFFKLDSEYLANHVLQRSNELLTSHDYQGPLDEFCDARKDLVAGSNKDAIHKANKAFESVLKIIEQKTRAKPGELLHGIPKEYFSGLPESFVKDFPDKVLHSLSFIRNEISGHGQGKDVVKDADCRDIANLAVNIAGSFIVFVIQRQMALKQPARKNLPPDVEEVPF